METKRELMQEFYARCHALSATPEALKSLGARARPAKCFENIGLIRRNDFLDREKAVNSFKNKEANLLLRTTNSRCCGNLDLVFCCPSPTRPMQTNLAWHSSPPCLLRQTQTDDTEKTIDLVRNGQRCARMMGKYNLLCS